jgi:hypothetical protein
MAPRHGPELSNEIKKPAPKPLQVSLTARGRADYGQTLHRTCETLHLGLLMRRFGRGVLRS